MKRLTMAAALAAAACAGGPGGPPGPPPTPPAELMRIHDALEAPGLEDRRFNHDQYWSAMAPYLGGNVSSQVVGTSAEGREIRQLTFGSGPTTVLLWSQMHGNESTASMALVDIVRFFHERARRATRGGG